MTTTKSLNGSRTKPLTEDSLSVLKEIALRPVPRQEVNPGVADRLDRGRLVETIDLPSPYRTRPGKVPHLRITEEGRAELARRAEKSPGRVALLKIDNCLDCPYSKEIRDPSSRDSFDAHDVSLACTKAALTGRTTTVLGDRIPGRLIVALERSIRREKAGVPAWCPMLKEKP